MKNAKVSKRGAVLSGAALLVIASMPIEAHHSTQVSYQMDRVIPLSGVVTEFRFHNPHSQLFFDVVDEHGKTVHWAAELASPGNWARQGWGRSTFKPGDKVSFSMHPSKSGEPVGHPDTITMADGTVVDQGGQRVVPGAPRGGGGGD